jgi:hypothetical protein
MLSAKQMTYIQKLGQQTFTVVCDIYKRLPYAHDDSNPYGDDTVTFAVTYKRVKGWLVPTASADFNMDVGQLISKGEFLLRVPVGTDVGSGDKVKIAGADYFCSDSTTEQTWPEWLTVRLRKAQ